VFGFAIEFRKKIG